MSEAVAQIVEYRSPRKREELTAYLGMVIFLGSWAMMFAGLFFAYGIVRSHAEVWPPANQPRIPLLLPGINTVLVLISSGLFQIALISIRQNKVRACTQTLGGAGLFGVAFMVMQVVVWSQLWNAGLVPSSGPYASVFYGLTAVHAAHVLVGLGALGVLTFRSWRGDFSAARFLQLRLWAMYWHFVAAVWLLMYLTIYAI